MLFVYCFTIHDMIYGTLYVQDCSVLLQMRHSGFDASEHTQGFGLLTCLVCLRRRTRSITNERSPGCSILRCCHGIAQGQLGVIDDLVGPAEWWTSSWAVPC